jgi:hypothetical protein
MVHERFEMTEGPERFVAGQHVTVQFRFTVGEVGLQCGSRLKLGLPSVGWGEPLVNHHRYWDLKSAEGNRWLHYKRLNTTFEIQTQGKAYLLPSARQEQRRGEKRCMQRWWVTFEVVEDDLMPGDVVTLTYGDRTWGEPGGQVQPVVQKGGDFALCVVSPDGEVREVEGSPVWVNVEAGPTERAFLRLPSVAAEGTDPQPRVYFTDRCGNHPSDKPPAVLPRLVREADVLRAAAEVPGLEVAHNPCVVAKSGALPIFWGDIHGKTNFSADGLAPIDDYITYARDVSGADFTCVTDHSGCVGDGWLTTQEKAAQYTRNGQFVALKGFEYSYAHGHRNVYFDNHCVEDPWPREWLDLDGERRFFSVLRERKAELVSIPHHTLVWTDWNVYDAELEPVCEVYSMWGCSERTVAEGNTLWDKSCIPGGGAQAGLARGYRFGFIAASDTHSGFPGRQYPDRYGFCFSYKAGLAAIRAPELTAHSLIAALKARNCYGTTGARMVLDFSVNGAPMGSEIRASGPRDVTGRVVGTDRISRIDIVRNNRDWRVLTPETDDCSFEAADEQSLTASAFYYLRATQADGEMAWSSPVWVEAATG